MDTIFDPADVAAFEHATWSRCAPTYRDGFGALTRQAHEPMLDAANVQPGTRVLDIGTGTADLAMAARERGGVPTAIDFSDAMVAQARRFHPDLDVRLASADSLPFADRTYDAVVANCVLHHLADPPRALNEAQRVLTARARIACTIWAAPETLDAFGLFFGAVAEHADVPDLPHGPLFGLTDHGLLTSLFDDAGFHDVSIRQLDTAWPMATIDDLLTAFDAWAQLDAFPPDSRHAIESSVRQRAAAYTTTDGLLVPNPMLMLTATKA